jgi:phosphate transport system protein
MTHLDLEIRELKSDIIEMWNLVITQLYKSNEAFERFDKELAHEVTSNEKRVDAFELKINMDCENILALFNPVANDLRFVLSVLSINFDLERIGDYARSVAKIVSDSRTPFSKESVEKSKIPDMYSVAIKMLADTLEAFEKEDNLKVRSVFKRDDELDKVNKNANEIIASLIKQYPDDVINHLNLLTVIRKLERMGDQTKAIAEEIVFYVEAKVLRHKKKKEKLQ